MSLVMSLMLCWVLWWLLDVPFHFEDFFSIFTYLSAAWTCWRIAHLCYPSDRGVLTRIRLIWPDVFLMGRVLKHFSIQSRYPKRRHLLYHTPVNIEMYAKLLWFVHLFRRYRDVKMTGSLYYFVKKMKVKVTKHCTVMEYLPTLTYISFIWYMMSIIRVMSVHYNIMCKKYWVTISIGFILLRRMKSLRPRN